MSIFNLEYKIHERSGMKSWTVLRQLRSMPEDVWVRMFQQEIFFFFWNCSSLTDKCKMMTLLAVECNQLTMIVITLNGAHTAMS